MKTATLLSGHVYGTTNISWLEATYRGETLFSSSFHEGQLSGETERAKDNLRNRGFTDYKTGLTGKPIKL